MHWFLQWCIKNLYGNFSSKSWRFKVGFLSDLVTYVLPESAEVALTESAQIEYLKLGRTFLTCGLSLILCVCEDRKTSAELSNWLLTLLCLYSRSLLSRESLASTTLGLSESQSTLSVKQEWSHGYRTFPFVPPDQGLQNGSELGDLLNFSPETSVSSSCVSNSLPSYLYGMENKHSTYSSPRHSSARSQSTRSKKRALSLSPLSDGIGIDFNTIIRTSPTSLVAYINSSRTSPANISPQPEVYGHFLGVRGSCIPQSCSIPTAQKGLLMANGNVTFPGYIENGAGEYQRMQQLEQASLQMAATSNMVIQQGMPPVDNQAVGVLKNERLDYFSGHTVDMPPPPLLPAPPPQGPPPPYHAHQHRHPHSLPGHIHPLPVPPPAPDSLFDEDGELDDFSGKHGCRWVDCGALYDQQEELVQHIEKIHIDQRKGEDFTCFWAGCPRRYKPFNARYKLLIHMRVHSGEKPNKCTVSLNSVSLTNKRCSIPHENTEKL